ncbi:hypothetical protein OH77DRAFT_1430336 [Trametes cingulata]|nr:hypothetical protein OH77DRAFT_1430336 [Trametes cingulata]
MSGAYDERLLASAPAATRAEKQEGYDIDLLDDRHHGARGVSTSPPPAVPILAPNHAKAEVGGYSYAPSRVTPWYKTRKWVVIFVIGALVIIGAIVGGAVGGTVGGDKKSNAAATKSGDPGGATGPSVSQVGNDPGEPASRSQASPTSSATDGSHDPGSALSSAISAAASASTTQTSSPGQGNA